jgi:CIC family chloride channel protein
VNGQELVDWLATLDEDGLDSADVTESSLRRWTIAPLPEQATLRQALDTLRRRTVEAVCVYTRDNAGKPLLRGVVTRDSIERFTLSQIDV